MQPSRYVTKSVCTFCDVVWKQGCQLSPEPGTKIVFSDTKFTKAPYTPKAPRY